MHLDYKFYIYIKILQCYILYLKNLLADKRQIQTQAKCSVCITFDKSGTLTFQTCATNRYRELDEIQNTRPRCIRDITKVYC